MITYSQHVLNAEYKFSDTEDEIVDYINRNRQNVSHMSISKLGQATFVAPNAITRLCKKLGYSGFVELKLALKERDEDTSNEVAEQRVVINRNFELIDSHREDQVIEMLQEARKILFFAVGETAYVAHDFAYTFNAIDHKCQFVTYENQIIYEIENNANLVVFCISQSGETAQVLRVAKAVKQKNHQLVSLTGLSENSLNKLADTSLFSYSPLKLWHGFNFTDKTPLFIIMNSLFNRYFSELV